MKRQLFIVEPFAVDLRNIILSTAILCPGRKLIPATQSQLASVDVTNLHEHAHLLFCTVAIPCMSLNVLIRQYLIYNLFLSTDEVV